MSEPTPHADAVVRAMPESEDAAKMRDRLDRYRFAMAREIEALAHERDQLKEVNEWLAVERERLITERDETRQDRDEWKALHGSAVHEMQARLDRQERENAVLRRAYEHACEQRDKYMRRTAEWRQAACTGCANGCEGCDPMEGRNHV